MSDSLDELENALVGSFWWNIMWFAAIIYSPILTLLELLKYVRFKRCIHRDFVVLPNGKTWIKRKVNVA